MADVAICFGLLFEIALRSWQWGTLQSCLHAVRRVGRERKREASCGSAEIYFWVHEGAVFLNISTYTSGLQFHIVLMGKFWMEVLILSCVLLRARMFSLLYFDSQNRFAAKEQFVDFSIFNRARAKNEVYIISLCLQKYYIWGVGVAMDSHINFKFNIKLVRFCH